MVGLACILRICTESGIVVLPGYGLDSCSDYAEPCIKTHTLVTTIHFIMLFMRLQYIHKIQSGFHFQVECNRVHSRVVLNTYRAVNCGDYTEKSNTDVYKRITDMYHIPYKLIKRMSFGCLHHYLYA